MNILNPYRFGVGADNLFIGGVGATTITSAADLAALTSLSIGDISNFSIDADDNVSCFVSINYTINGSAFLSDSALTYYIDSLCTSFGNSSFRGAENCLIFILTGTTTCGASSMGLATSPTKKVNADIVSLPLLTPIGGSNGYDTVWEQATIAELYTDSTNETNNGGSPDGDITTSVVISNINYSTNSTPPDDVTDLAVDSVNGASIIVSWTAPTSINAIDYYLIFRGFNYIGKTDSLGYTITDLSLSTSYDIRVMVIDEMGNNSEFSNVLTASTAATYYVPSLISYWNFNSNSLDQTGSNNGTDTSMSYDAGGVVGNRGNFTAGISSKVSIADDNSLTFGNGTIDDAFSISLWFKFGTKASTVFIAKKDISTGQDGEFQIAYDGVTDINFFLFSNLANVGTDRLLAKATGVSLSTGVWYNLICVYGGGGAVSDMDIFLNGIVTTQTKALTGTYGAIQNGNAPVTIGKNPQTTTRSLNGYMDEVAIISTKLTSAQAFDIYKKGLAGTAVNA